LLTEAQLLDAFAVGQIARPLHHRDSSAASAV
jgi:hypothetical protein